MVIGGLFCSEGFFQLPLVLADQFMIHEQELSTGKEVVKDGSCLFRF